jgi:hypothetical protein
MYITLKFDAQCADCGALLKAGTRARYFRDGSVYGNECHRWNPSELPHSVRVKFLVVVERLAAAVKANRNNLPSDIAQRLHTIKERHSRQMTPALIRECKQLLKAIDAKSARKGIHSL